MAEEKTEQPEAGTKKPGLLDNKVIMLGGVVALQLVLAVGLTTMVLMPKLGAGQADAGAGTNAMVETEEMGVLLSLQEVIVTLRDDGTGNDTRYLRINVDLELVDQAAADVATSRLPILRDTVIVTLSDRTAADLSRPEGMKGLRDELMRRLDERLPGEVLRHIYFSDLVIQ